ncbi:MAG: hypothetical protein LBR33_01575 [Propionibacteriaceae bacterium]|jgi:hypothetical protein|nr:hypothetical protein [Propionibacteriaceae bacterium]
MPTEADDELEGVTMTDVLIPDVDEEDLARFDRAAAYRGMTRQEYLLLKIVDEPEPQSCRRRATVEDFVALAEAAKDVLNPEVMAGAWH